MRARLNEFFKVKSIVTIALTIVFCYLAVEGIVSGRDFLTIFTTVIAFYFGTKNGKDDKHGG